jgi:hypothetical protein
MRAASSLKTYYGVTRGFQAEPSDRIRIESRFSVHRVQPAQTAAQRSGAELLQVEGDDSYASPARGNFVEP